MADKEFNDNIYYGGDAEEPTGPAADGPASGYDSGSGPGERPRRRGPWMTFLMLLAGPVQGWKRIKASRYEPQEYARTLFFPLLALMAACTFSGLFYRQGTTVATLLQEAIAAFVAGFGGYYLVLLLSESLLPVVAREKIQAPFGKIYVMACMSALALSMTLWELFPFLELLLMVLPIYVAYIVVKGLKPLRVPDREETSAAILLIVLILGIPTAIYFILLALMPTP